MEETRDVLVVGIAHREPPRSLWETVWRAVEDAGAVPSVAHPVYVFADAEEVPEWAALPGLEVRSAGAADVFAAAVACLRAEPAALAVVYHEPTATAAALARTAPDHAHGPLAPPAERVAQLAVLQPHSGPKNPRTPASWPSAVPLLVSGRSEAGLRAFAHDLAEHLVDHPGVPLPDLAYTLAAARTVWPHRTVVHAADHDAAVTALRALAAGAADSAGVHTAHAQESGAVFVFPGQGAQWVGMARELAAGAPVFAERLAACGRALRPHLDIELDDILSGAVPMDRVETIQPALFAVMVSLAELWRSNGVVPCAMVGHSFGEIAAVTAAGGLCLEDGARLVATVSRTLALLEGEGDMVAVALGAEELAGLVAEWGLQLENAVVNGPRSTVVSGPPEAAARLLERLADRGVWARRLPIGIAGHSRHMDRIRERLTQEVASIRPRASTVPVYGSTTTAPLATAHLDPAHWFRCLRSTANFRGVTEALLAAGHRLFVEISPHPVLALSIEETAAHVARPAVVLDTMRRDDAGHGRYLCALAESQLHGAAPDWATALPGAARVPLPPYRFDRDAADDAGDEETAPLRGQLAGLDEAGRLSAVLQLVLDALPVPEDELVPAADDFDRDFRSLGLDSAGSLRVRHRLVQSTGVRLPVTALFDHPTPRHLAEEILRLLFGEPAAATFAEEDADASAPRDEPIAVVGMACRLPGGVRSPEDLWRMVLEGREGIAPFPTDRGWDLDARYDPDATQPGTCYQRAAGLLDGVDEFDAAFFGIARREALAMDPQQRLLLETAWEALERGGIVPGALRGSRTGVFTGVMHLPYGRPPHQAAPELEGYVVTGTTSSMASGRLSYVLGLEGPAVTVDTACSSSLVALHLACQALRNGECDTALAGGATVMAEPGLFIEFSRLRALAPDGRCKAFSADADGFGMAEGVGVLVVERLSDARRLGHHVLAVVRGSAVNQDGASNGMTAPNGPAQQRVIQAALRNAQLPAAEVDLLEAHGTGTRLGDPIEAHALQATYGQAHTPERPLHLGSLKSNLGHTQAAAGVAGVIKAIQAMRHRTLPPTLHAEHPTPEVDWTPGTLHLLTRSQPWEPGTPPRRAGVSSFGISGTNTHVLLEEGDPLLEDPPTSPPWAEVGVPLVLSAKTPEALRAQAAALHDHLADHPEQPLHHTARTLALHRTHHPYRTTCTGTRDQLLQRLANPTPTKATPTHLTALYPGQGTHQPALGHRLADHFPAYAHALQEAAVHLDSHLPQPLHALLDTPNPAHDTQLTQPTLFAHQYALTRLYQAHGLSPTTLIGHSLGEITAATIAGVLTLQDAARLITARARLMHQLPPHGAMLALQATEAEVTATLTEHADPAHIGIAALNGPQLTVVSGTTHAVHHIADLYRARGRRTTPLHVHHAFHSPLVEPVLDALRPTVESLRFAAPTIPLIPTAASPHPMTSPEYWLDQVRHTVRFHDAAAQLPEADLLLEIGPDAGLAALLETDHVVLPAPRRGRSETQTVLDTLARVHAHGGSVDWSPLFPPAPAVRPADLPTYAFQRARYWSNSAPEGGTSPGTDPQSHPLLSLRTELPDEGGALLSGRLAPASDPWLSHHVVRGTVLLPGTGFVELALEAARAVGAGSVDELVLSAPMVFPAGEPRDIQVWVSPPDASGDRTLRLRTRGTGEGWTLHATGTLATRTAETSAFTPDWTGPNWPPPGADPVPGETFYADLAARGYEYGPAFHGTRALWQRGDDLFAEVVLPEGQPQGFGIHPALLDAALHALPLTRRLYEGDEVRLPFSFSGVSLFAADARRLRVRVQTAPSDPGAAAVSITDSAGNPVLALESLTLRALEQGQLEATKPVGRFAVTWERLPDAATAPEVPGSWLVLGEAPEGLDAVFQHPLTRGSWDRPIAPDGVLVCATRAEELLDALHELAELTAPVWCVTRGAVGVGVADPEADVHAAGVWGLGRVAALELPERWGGLVDLPATNDEATRRLLAGLLTGGGAEDQLAVRDGALWARRLAPAPAPPVADWKPKGTVLLTGGTGGLGGHVARWLAAHGDAEHLVLLSRQGPAAPGATELLDELAAAGASAVATAVDVTDRAALTALLTTLESEGTPVRSVVHTAGVVSEVPLHETTVEQLATETAAKVEGALLLDELLPELEEFVLFSSISGIWGAAGQAGYAAGNACLDALARRRRAQGRPATALAWGPWSGGGMLTERDERALRRRGLTPLTVPGALHALGQSVAAGADAVLADVDWARFLPAFTTARPSPLLAGFDHAPPARTPTSGEGSLGERLAALPEDERDAAALEVVRAEVASLVGESDPERVDPSRALKDIGFDSLMSVELRNRFADLLGGKLPATLVFDHPTPHALAGYLQAQLALGEPEPADGSLLDAFARVESAALAPSTGSAQRAELAARLDALRERLAALDAPSELATSALESASADELMQFIDSEFGTPDSPSSGRCTS